MGTPLQIGLIMGSVREGRWCSSVADWVCAEMRSRGDMTLTKIDPLALGLVTGHDGAVVNDLKRQLEAMDGFIVVTPEYNHSFPAALKLLIDSAYREWQAKPVAFVSYGGIAGGVRAVEQLRQVFAELHTVTIRDAVALPNIWAQFDERGDLKDARHPLAALERMTTRLAWWARATRNARWAEPYHQTG